MTCSYEMKSLIILAFYFLSLFAHTNGDGFSSAFDLLLSRPLKQNSPPPDYASLIPNGTLFYKDENPRDPIFLDHNPKPGRFSRVRF